MKLNDHPTVKNYRKTPQKSVPEFVDHQWLRDIVLSAGADDVGIVEIEREELNEQKKDILHAFPKTKSIISYVCRLNPPQIQSPDRSLADKELIALDSEMEALSRRVVWQLKGNDISAVLPSENFPIDMLKWPGKMWTVSHKPIASAAGLGHLGHQRLLIHPTFGSFLCLVQMVNPMSKKDSPKKK